MTMIDDRAETALVTIPTADAMAVFTEKGKLDPYLAVVRKAIDAFHGDVTTKSGRDAIASMAYRVTRSKTALDAVGKGLVDDLKDLPKKIDANRKRIRDTLDAWRDEVRAPLDKFEADEKARVDKHVAQIDAIKLLYTILPDTDTAMLRARIADAESVAVGPSCEEFEEEYRIARDTTLGSLRKAFAAREQYERDQSELAALRAAQAERDAKEAQARAEHEAIERAKVDAERREREAVIAAERAEAQRVAAEERAAREKAEAEAMALRRADADRQRREREEAERKAAEERATAAREANKAHRGQVNRKAAEAIARLLAGNIDSDAQRQSRAQDIVAAIAKGQVPNVEIKY